MTLVEHASSLTGVEEDYLTMEDSFVVELGLVCPAIRQRHKGEYIACEYIFESILLFFYLSCIASERRQGSNKLVWGKRDIQSER